MQSVTIEVSDVTPLKEPESCLEVYQSVESLLQRRIEAMALADERLVCCKDTHPFAQAAHDAFYDHFPLTISPDDIWFCLVQGFANHVNLNAEGLRHKFVNHGGKLNLLVNRPDFILGRPNPWPEVFTAFSDQIARHIGQELHDDVVADFSTTTEFHRAASEVALMDTFQGYFEYEMLIGCGIPSIILTGAPDDWRDVRRRAASFAKYGLESWMKALLPVLDEIEATSRGHGNREFWQSFFRYKSGSFGSAMTGWINVLFPYLNGKDNTLVRNSYMHNWSVECRKALDDAKITEWRKRQGFEGPYLNQIPSGLVSAPVKVIDDGQGRSHDLRFVAGMFGISQDAESHALSPTFGWAITYDEPLPKKPLRPGFRSRQR
ncbi:MAG TPA: DUF4419 domain-containing protein [Tepidisphaeraceae bacterium]|nr:DUF4419 domain-containing protein [Tepidisphaeraceae bacterium]